LTSAVQHQSLQRVLGNSERLLVQESDMKTLYDVCLWYFSKAHFIGVVPMDLELVSDFVAQLLPLIHNKINTKITVSHITVPKVFNVSFGRLWKNLSVLHQGFILIVENGNTLLQFLKFMQQNNSYPFLRNPRGSFLIIFLDICESGHDEVSSNCIENKYSFILRTLWEELGILNVITMVINYSNYSKLKAGRIVLLETFNPFINQLNTRGKVAVYNENYVFNLARSYTDRLNNLRGYPFRISLFERTPTSFPSHPDDRVSDYIGMDGFFMRDLAVRMNFTTIAGSPKDGNKYGYMFENNGTFTGSLGDIIYDRAEISLNSRFVKEYGTGDIEFTMPVGFDNLCIVVPKAKRFPKWHALFRVFELQVLLALVSVYVACSVLSHILQVLCSFFMPVKDTSLIATFIETLLPFLSLPLIRVPPFRPQKVFVTACLAFGMIMASLFQGKLVTVLSKPDYYPDISTLEELDASGLMIGTGSLNLIEDTFNTEGSLLAKRLSNKVKYRITKESTIYYVAKRQNIAALTRLSNAIYNVLMYRNSDGTCLLHTVEEYPRTYSLAYIVPKGSPFLFRINRVIIQLVESGIIGKWNKDTYFNMTAFHRIEHSGNDSLKVFSLEDLQMAFLILACGLFSSAVAFFAELTVKRVASRKGVHCCKTFTWSQKQTLRQTVYVRPSFRSYKL
jgi:hypothetical protein